MRRFDLFHNENPRTRGGFPFLVVLQSDLLSGLATVVVAPLGGTDHVEGRPATVLMPVVIVDDVEYVVFLPELAAIPVRLLKRSAGSVASSREELVRGLDLLFDGI